MCRHRLQLVACDEASQRSLGKNKLQSRWTAPPALSCVSTQREGVDHMLLAILFVSLHLGTSLENAWLELFFRSVHTT